MYLCFAGMIPRVSASLVAKVGLVGFLTFSACGLIAQQGDPDRPRLSRQTQPMNHNDSPIDPPRTESADKASGTSIGNGLALPRVGHR